MFGLGCDQRAAEDGCSRHPTAIWIPDLASGRFEGGVLAYQEGNYPIFHLPAEFFMGGLATTAGIALLRHAGVASSNHDRDSHADW
jgi:hypothetical protein